MRNLEMYEARSALPHIMSLIRGIYGSRKTIELIPFFRKRSYNCSRVLLSYWTHGSHLPSSKNTLEVLESLQPFFEEIYSAYLKPDSKNQIRVRNALSDFRFEALVSCDVRRMMMDKKVDVVLTIENSGSSLANIVARSKHAYLAFVDTKPREDVGGYVDYEDEEGKWYMSYFSRGLLTDQKSRNVLVATDVLRTGRTTGRLLSIVPATSYKSVCALAAVGDAWKDKISLPQEDITILYNPKLRFSLK